MTENEGSAAIAEETAPDPGATEEYPLALAARIASRFQVRAPIEAHDFPEKGNIHQHTFLLSCGRHPGAREFLLQRINQQVFTRPRNVMAAMMASIEAQRRNLERAHLPPGREWHTIALIPTRDGAPYLEFRHRRGSTCWRLMERILDSRTYKSLGEVGDPGERLRVAEEAGRGLAMYCDLTSGMDISRLASPLPGYRDTRLYYGQFKSVLLDNRTLKQAAPFLPEDEVLRESTRQHFLVHLPAEEARRRREDPDLERFIRLVREEEDFGMTLLREMESGRLRRVAIHGDTKLDNFLFSATTGRVKALIDLDTILPHSWLADWGDMVRSLVNVVGEMERDLRKVRVDMEVYEALARGFLTTAREATSMEVEMMPEAVEIIALELGLRFLADHLRGDSYFKLGPADSPDLNKVRAMVQLTLFEKLRENREATRRLIREHFGRAKAAMGRDSGHA